MVDEHICGDLCIRDKWGKCAVRRRQLMATRKGAGLCIIHPTRRAAAGHVVCQECLNRHVKTELRKSLTTLKGRVAELLVVADLDARCGGEWILPDSVSNLPDDIAVKSSLGWYGVQVKVGQLQRRKSGQIAVYMSSKPGGRPITSDITALVDMRGLRVKYAANTKSLPPELPTEFVRLAATILGEGGECGSKVHSAPHAPQSEQRP